MNWSSEHLMELFVEGDAGQLLLDCKWGLEKEALRVDPSGALAMTPHPAAFGDKLTHPHITVDFSESQIELITPPMDCLEDTYGFLNELQLSVEEALAEELLWPLSMPGALPAEEQIPLARYGNSPDGQEKEIYRSGLALRYGKKMQMISGIHYNFSFGDRFWSLLYDRFGKNTEQRVFRDQVYIDLAKNFLEYRWLLIYLFGASPLGTEDYMKAFHQKNICVCSKPCCCQTFDDPVTFATSLRMSRFGYNNSFQNQLQISYNSLEQYIRSIRQALGTPIDDYTKLGIYRNGCQVQLNDNLLQSENEYYAPVRFKQGAAIGKTMLDALEQKGIEYLEFRTFDLNPFAKTGISLEQLYFIHVFILFCFFESTAELTKTDLDRFNDNAQLTALFGRSDRLKLLNRQGEMVNLRLWGEQIFDRLQHLAEILDRTHDTTKFQEAVKSQYAKLSEIDRLPSATIVNAVNANGGDYKAFGLERAMLNKELQRIKHIKAS